MAWISWDFTKSTWLIIYQKTKILGHTYKSYTIAHNTVKLFPNVIVDVWHVCTCTCTCTAKYQYSKYALSEKCFPVCSINSIVVLSRETRHSRATTAYMDQCVSKRSCTHVSASAMPRQWGLVIQFYRVWLWGRAGWPHYSLQIDWPAS